MEQLVVKPIGKVSANGYDDMKLVLEPQYLKGLQGLEGFSHLQVLWWFGLCDTPEMRAKLDMQKPYKSAPDVMGVFATRAPFRPNPIALTAAQVTYVDYENGIIGLAYIDAEDGSPVLDIKPYSPSLDVVKTAQMPSWCAHWPKNLEDSALYDWSGEIV